MSSTTSPLTLRLEVLSCLACGAEGTNTDEVFRAPFLGSRSVPVMRCPVCHTLYKKCSVETKKIRTHYTQDEYYSFQDSGELSIHLASRIERIKHYGLTQKILDVGCGNGRMVQEYLNQGWNAYGTDPFLQLNERENNRLFAIDIAEEDLPVMDFSTVTMWYILEHVLDPKSLLEQIANHMDSKGRIFILVPWSESMAARFYHQSWSEIWLDEHVAAYSKQGLTILLERCGFKNISFRFAGRPFPLGKVRLKMLSELGEDLHENNQTGNKVSQINRILGYVLRFANTSKPARKLSRSILTQLRIGDYIEVTAIKE